MLAENKLWINCHNTTKKHYESIGYEWKIKGQILVNISDLPTQSNLKIKLQCDYCKEVSQHTVILHIAIIINPINTLRKMRAECVLPLN